MLTQIAIAIFNRRQGPDMRDAWWPTTIARASIAAVDGSTVASDGTRDNAMDYKVRIPVDALIQGGRTYAPPAEYNAMDDADALGHWTIQPGDVAVVVDGIGVTFAAPMFPEDLDALTSRTEHIIIRAGADNTRRGTRAVQHWRIVGQ